MLLSLGETPLNGACVLRSQSSFVLNEAMCTGLYSRMAANLRTCVRARVSVCVCAPSPLTPSLCFCLSIASMSSGLLSSCTRTLLHASSIRSIALSGRKRLWT